MLIANASMSCAGPVMLMSYLQTGQQQAINSENSKLFWILFFIAFAFLVIAAAVVVLVFELLKTRTKVMTIVNDLHGRSLPILDKATHLMTELSPKVEDITGNVQHLTTVVRNKVEELEPTLSAANRTVKDANQKTHEQIVRVNEMVTGVLNSTQEMVDKVDAGIKVPFREASSLWAGVKAGWATLRTGRRPASSRPDPAGTGESAPNRYSQATAHSPTSAAQAAAEAFGRAERHQDY